MTGPSNIDEDGTSSHGAFDLSVASAARTYDYLLGGKDNFWKDRERGDAIEAVFPAIRTTVRENRRFLGRAVEELTRVHGIRQFLDIGPGLPNFNNTHEVAQRIAPDSRVVYVDRDPMVMSWTRAFMLGEPGGGDVAHIEADLREPHKILDRLGKIQLLDLTQPVGLILVAVLHFVLDDQDPYGAVATLVHALPAGSFLVMSHATRDFIDDDTVVSGIQAADRATGVEFQFRSLDEFARFFAGLELLEPGIVSTVDWHDQDEPKPRPSREDVAGYAAVARIGETPVSA